VTRENGGLLGRHEARLATEDNLGLGAAESQLVSLGRSRSITTTSGAC
jgi:hypothetical protein